MSKDEKAKQPKEKKIKEKKVKQPKEKKLHSSFALKRGGYAIGFTAIVIAVFVVVNVLATALTARFPLNVDLTANSDYSISSKNIDYIRGVTRPVTITVCATEDNYSTYMAQYASYYYSATDSTNGQYYTQTLTLLDEYAKYNSNISVVFMDPDDPDFSDVKARVGDSANLTYGSILVESTFDLNGTETYRSKVLAFSDLYEVTDSTGGYASYYGYGYELTGSKVESAVTSAIYSVTSDKTTEVGYIASRMDTSVLDGLTSTLSDNNYNVTAIDNLLTYDIDSSIEVLIIAAPTSDYSAEELQKIDTFLDNGGERGKTLLFFGSSDSPNLPNLYDFLAEWGINCSSGTVCETNSSNYLSGDMTTIGLQNDSSDYTTSMNDLSRIYVAGGNIPMSVGYETQGNRTTTEMMATSETAVLRPSGAGSDWSADSGTQTQYSTAIASCDMLYNEDYTEKKSYVVAFSSVNFISSDWLSYTGSVGNMEFVLSALNTVSGRDADTVTFTDKTIDVDSFSDKVTDFKSNLVKIIFVGLLPIGAIASGIIVWVRRKNR